MQLSHAAFYTELERRWEAHGLTVQKRVSIVQGDPTQGWRWLLRQTAGDGWSTWVSFNVTDLFPGERWHMKRDDKHTPVESIEEMLEMVVNHSVQRIDTLYEASQ